MNKVMKAPEKIYIDANENWLRTYTAFTEKAKGNDIEYIREDAFIDKAGQWIRDNYLKYPSEDCGDTTKFVMDFRKYMKGE